MGRKSKPQMRKLDLSKYVEPRPVPKCEIVNHSLKWFPLDIWKTIAKYLNAKDIAGLQIAYDLKTANGTSLYTIIVSKDTCPYDILFLKYFGKKIDFFESPGLIRPELFDEHIKNNPDVWELAIKSGKLTGKQTRLLKERIRIKYFDDIEYEVSNHLNCVTLNDY